MPAQFPVPFYNKNQDVYYRGKIKEMEDIFGGKYVFNCE